jgi:hypothetical protein
MRFVNRARRNSCDSSLNVQARITAFLPLIEL